MPDIDRAAGDQEKEIEELERKIEKLKEIIGDFGERSTKAMASNGTSR